VVLEAVVLEAVVLEAVAVAGVAAMVNCAVKQRPVRWSREL
jgi:hypothetical protein